MDVRQGVYTIPSGTGFLKALAKGLLAMVGDRTEGLAEMRVLLPTRRAGRELREAFLSLSAGKPLLLPRIQPIGDIDAEEVELLLSGLNGVGDDIPPAISSLERQFLLAALIQKKDASLGLDAALALATDLARLIDTVHTEDMDFAGLANIVPADLSEHWRQTLDFLDIVTTNWPLILAARGQIDPADRRNRLLKAQAKLWREHPPETPVIAAGSTGSIPSSGELLSVISNLPCGCVILPGLDLGLENDSWENISDTHPQCTMRNLLRRMGIERRQVRLWPEASSIDNQRTALLRAVMRPTETFAADNESLQGMALSGFSLLEAANPREEAAIIALTLREVMEHENRTACLVTPDRNLARRVMTALHRWGIEVDDSAGGALATTSAATFLVAILRVMEENFAPLPLLDFLKHNYQRKISPELCRDFEISLLRGGRPGPGLDGLRARLARIAHDKKSNSLKNLTVAVEILAQNFAGLLALSTGQHPVKDFTEALIKVAETFALERDFLWTRPESEATSSFLSGLMGYTTWLPPVDMRIFGGVFRELLLAENYRPQDAPHRRILILGQMESRLIQRDVMILSGLNEGTWPRDPGYDPWMSRPMRKNFGLPTVERSTGLAALDFVEHASSSNVVVTRSLKNGGTATVPARWLQKLKTLLIAADCPSHEIGNQQALHWVRRMDAAPEGEGLLSAKIPSPCPPLAVRPQTLSATVIEKWIKNPYRIYAERIARLKRLDLVDMDTTHAERGSFVHDVLLDFVRAYPYALPDNSEEIILGMAKEKLAAMEYVSLQWKYWWPRFERLVNWYVSEERKWREEALPWIQEEQGAYTIFENAATNRRFTITAKADRIDRKKEGGVTIIDYKTGTLPPAYGLRNGSAPQLPIEALIAAKGGYRNSSVTPAQLLYWKLSGSFSSAGKVIDHSKKLDMEEVVAATGEGLLKLIEKFEDPQTPYLARPLSGKLYDDERAYAHLARVAEWASDAFDEDEGDFSTEEEE